MAGADLIALLVAGNTAALIGFWLRIEHRLTKLETNTRWIEKQLHVARLKTQDDAG